MSTVPNTETRAPSQRERDYVPIYVDGMSAWSNVESLAYRQPWTGDFLTTRVSDWVEEDRRVRGTRHVEPRLVLESEDSSSSGESTVSRPMTKDEEVPTNWIVSAHLNRRIDWTRRNASRVEGAAEVTGPTPRLPPGLEHLSGAFLGSAVTSPSGPSSSAGVLPPHVLQRKIRFALSLAQHGYPLSIEGMD